MSVRALEHERKSASGEGAPEGSFEYYWDAVAKTAMGRYVTEIETGFIEHAIEQLARPPAVAVDAGAGSGRLTRVLAARAGRVIATEAKQELIAPLSKIAPNVTPQLVSSQSAALALQDESVDLVIAIEAAALTQSPEFHRECARVLRPGGVLVLTLQNRASWKGLLGRLRRDHYRAEHGASYYDWSFGDLKRSLSDASLIVTGAAGLNWLPFTRDSDSALIGPLSTVERAFGLRKLASVSPWVLVAARRGVEHSC